MTPEEDKYLVEKYPIIFKDRYGDIKNTAMCWGFDCGSGWFFLIDNLCNSIKSYIDCNSHRNIPPVVATQLKEKYGTLRFYYTGGDDIIDGMVSFAEDLSASICERCGSFEGKVNKEGYWLSCLCEDCRESPK